MQRKIFLTILSLVLLSSGVLFTLLACSNGSAAVPHDFTFQNRIITWDKVDNAEGYVVTLDGKEYETDKNSFDTLPYIKDAGEYFVEVRAVFEGGENGAFAKYRFDVTEPLKSGYDENGFLYTLLEDKSGYEISKGTADLSGMLVIPDYFDGLPVTKIADYAFSTHITIIYPNPVTGEFCHEKTTAIFLGEQIKIIGKRAFVGFTNITNIVIPDGVTEIGEEAFYGCANLESVFFPDSLERISAWSFASCAFTRLIIPESVKFVGNNAFNGCKKLEYIDLRGDFEYFGASVFNDTAWYESKENGVVSIGSVIYEVKGSVEWKIFNFRIDEFIVPENITCIAASAFYCCNVRSLVVHDGVCICEKAFYCSTLLKVRLPSDIEVLYDYVFANTHLNSKAIVLPKTLKKVSVTAFKNAGIINIFYEGNYNEWKNLFELDTQPELFVELVSSKATLYFYSETEPEENGNYWRYVDGEPTAW